MATYASHSTLWASIRLALIPCFVYTCRRMILCNSFISDVFRQTDGQGELPQHGGPNQRFLYFLLVQCLDAYCAYGNVCVCTVCVRVAACGCMRMHVDACGCVWMLKGGFLYVSTFLAFVCSSSVSLPEISSFPCSAPSRSLQCTR